MNTLEIHLPPAQPNPPQILRSETRIRFDDCDPYGHMNNGHYPNFFIRTREDQVREYYDWDFYQYGNTSGRGWVVAKHEIIYRRPARYNEVVNVDTALIFAGPRNLLVEASLYDQQRTELKAVQRSTFVHVNLKTGRPEPHGEYLDEFFRRVLQPATTDQLSERVKELEGLLLQLPQQQI